MNETIQQKQNFLRTNILEKGYDGNQFVEFLTKKKGPEGADISSWTLHDLQIVNIIYIIYFSSVSMNLFKFIKQNNKIKTPQMLIK